MKMKVRGAYYSSQDPAGTQESVILLGSTSARLEWVFH